MLDAELGHGYVSAGNSFALTGSAAAGTRIIAVVVTFADPVTSFTGSTGLAWEKDGEHAFGPSRITVYSAPAPAGKAAGSTVSVIAGFSDYYIILASYTGVDMSAAPLNVPAVGVDVSNFTDGAWSVGPITTTADGCLIISIGATASNPGGVNTPNAPAADAGQISGNEGYAMQYDEQVTAGTISRGGTWSSIVANVPAMILAYNSASVAPSNTTPPIISGDTFVGDVQTASASVWDGTPPITVTRQWLIETAIASGVYTNISGQTGNTYSPVSGNVGKYLKIRDSAISAAGGPITVDSAAFGPVAFPPSPTNSRQPIILGVPAPGHPVRADDGAWANNPVLTRQWSYERLDGTYTDYLSGTTPYLNPDISNVGFHIKFRVMAVNGGGSLTVESNPVLVQPNLYTSIRKLVNRIKVAYKYAPGSYWLRS